MARFDTNYTYFPMFIFRDEKSWGLEGTIDTKVSEESTVSIFSTENRGIADVAAAPLDYIAIGW
jgi:hypothetical protein